MIKDLERRFPSGESNTGQKYFIPLNSVRIQIKAMHHRFTIASPPTHHYLDATL
jgi:hypothetical protein